MFEMALRVIALILLFVTLSACGSIGNNKSYLLKYKKHLIEWYEEEIGANSAEGERSKDAGGSAADKKFLAKQQQRIVEANTYLPSIYKNNMPYMLTNHYDSRGPSDSKIWKGDPLSVIINKVYLANNKETFSKLGDTGEIGIVVSIEDGKGNEPKNVLVSYEEGVDDKVFLPISDLLAYHTDVYNDEPIQIKLTVFEFDQLENDNFKKILGTAALIGSALTPAYAPAISAASQLGDFLIKQNQDDIIAKFTFQLYPWDQASARGRITGSNGVPRVTYGHYVIVNMDNADEGKSVDDFRESIFADFGLTVYQMPSPVTNPRESKAEVVNAKKLSPWPNPSLKNQEAIPLPWSYVVLTVTKTSSQNSDMVIHRLNSVNRTAAGLSNFDSLNAAKALALGQQLDELKSNLVVFTETDQFDQRKTDPSAVQRLFDTLESPAISDTDKVILLRKVADLLPAMTNDFKSRHSISEDMLKNKDYLLKWYRDIKNRLVFDPGQNGYSCKEEGKADCSN